MPITKLSFFHFLLDSLGTNWVLGAGHSIHSLLEYEEQTGKMVKDLLDEYIVDAEGNTGTLAAIILEETSHSVWVNNLALTKAGITDAVKNEKGAVYMRNNATNELNGILLENAGNMIMEKVKVSSVFSLILHFLDAVPGEGRGKL